MPHRPPALTLALLVALGLAAAGCAVPGAIAYKVFGPPAVPARYVPPATEPLLVLVENPHSGSAAIPEADELSRVIHDELAEHKVAVLIDPAKVHQLRDTDPLAFTKMTIADIGRAVGAKRVLYVHIDRLAIDNPTASDMVTLNVAADVKVVDATDATTLWPDSGDSETFTYESPHQRIQSGDSAAQLKRQVLRDSGVKIARWFYPWKPETMSEENRDVNLR